MSYKKNTGLHFIVAQCFFVKRRVNLNYKNSGQKRSIKTVLF